MMSSENTQIGTDLRQTQRGRGITHRRRPVMGDTPRRPRSETSPPESGPPRGRPSTIPEGRRSSKRSPRPGGRRPCDCRRRRLSSSSRCHGSWPIGISDLSSLNGGVAIRRRRERERERESRDECNRERIPIFNGRMMHDASTMYCARYQLR